MQGWHWFRYVIEDGPEQRERVNDLCDAAKGLGLEAREEPGPGYCSVHIWTSIGAEANVANVKIYFATNEAPTDAAPLPEEPWDDADE